MLWSDKQVSGRGTSGREWVSPPGGLYYSLAFPARLVSSPDPLMLLGAACVWKDLLSERCPEIADGLSLKWPNDLLHNGQKLGGFLANKHSDMLYLGVGINVNNSFEGRDPELRRPPVSLVDLTQKTFSTSGLVLEWGRRFYDAVTEADRTVFKAARLEAHLSTIGSPVELDRGTGRAVALKDNGELVVELDEERHIVHSPDDVEVLLDEAGG